MASEKEESVEFVKNLKQLECPFTWEMDDIDKSISTDYKPHDEEELIPLLKLMRIVMTVYVQSKENEETDNILSNLEKCDDVMVQITEQSRSQISTNAVYHIVQATQCNILWKVGEKEKSKKIFKEIKTLNPKNKIEHSTIYACRSICWSKYHTVGSEEAVHFIRQALIENSDCDLWHFILGKNLRRIRRDLSVGAIPSDEEKDALLKAYEKNKNVVYGIFVAQMYREERKNRKAIEMYEEIFRSKPKSHTIYLRLALGFIQLFRMPLAKQCLDEVAVNFPEDCMYLHYRGHYYMKLKKFKEAAYYLKKAADMGNCPAAKSYLRCMININSSFDATNYLLTLIEKFKNLPENQIQTLLLDTAVSFLSGKKSYKDSLKYFLLAIDIDPKSKALTEYYSCFKPGTCQNVYNLLASEIFPLIKQLGDSVDEKTLELFDELKGHFDAYMEDETQYVQNALSKI